MPVTAQLTRGLTLGGVQYQQSTAKTGEGAHVASATVVAGSPGTVTAQAQSSATVVTGTVWSANVATYTTSAAHGLVVGQIVVITGASPTGYNGTYVVASVPTTTTFTVASLVSLGAWVSGGTVSEPFTLTTTAAPQALLVAAARVDVFILIAGVTTCRYGCTIGAVVGNAISLTGGAGASFPANATTITIVAPQKVYLPMVYSNILAYVADGGTLGHSQFVFTQSDGATVVYAPYLDVGVTDLWDSDWGPVANPFGTATTGFVYMSHDAATAQSMSSGFLAAA